MDLSIKINADKEGYTGRECFECEKYFKIKFGTGLLDAIDCHCPYCNYIGPQDKFWTKKQIEYAQSVALNRVSGDLLKSMKKLEMKPNRNQLVSIGIKVKGQSTPISYYTEDELEEKITCDNCTLEYTIYGAFGFCPDCGIHNSKQIVDANFLLVLKILDLASTTTNEIMSKLIENALEDCISVFDGYARELSAGLYKKISFQNIEAAHIRLLLDHNIDISNGLNPNQWLFIVGQFQKRHLIAHKMGIMDKEYINRINGSPDLIGRKVDITEENVRKLILHLQTVTKNLFNDIKRS